MNEKYGIELELITQKFKQKINKIKNAFKGIGNQKIDMSKQVKVNSLTREFELAHNQAEMLRNKLKTLNSEMSRMQSWQVGTKPYIKLQNEIDKTNLQFQKASIKVDNLNDKLNSLETPKLSTGMSQSTSMITKGIETMTSKIKRFGLALFSIRSIWALVSKASSAYLAQDTELADKLQSVWAGLGSMLAPIIEGIVNILMKAVGYVNIFIKALTGVDLLARASAKSMNKAAKSAKGLNKSLAGFDELNNLDTNKDAGISNPFASIQNVELPWAETVKAFGEWVKENLPTVIGLLGGLTGAIIILKMGLGGIKALGIGTMIFGIIKLIGDLINYLKDPSWENFGKIIQNIGFIIMGLGLIIGGPTGLTMVIAGAIAIIIGLIVSNWEKIKEFLQGGIDWLVSKTDWIRENFGILGQVVYEIFTGALQELLNMFDGIFRGVKTIFDGILKVFKGIFTGDMKMVLDGFKQMFKGVFDSLWSIAKAPLNLIIRGINMLIRGANKIKFDVPDWVPGLGGKQFGFNIPQIPLLNVGTNYVPEDQLAYIHKGEAVVPKKFNSKEYFGTGNDETNSLLEQVIEAIENIEIAPYTTIKDVGKASVNYIKSKNRQLGRSVI